MHTIATSTSTRPVVAIASGKVTGPTLLAAAYGGTVKFAKVRETGTLRHWPVLAPNTPARKQAEEIMKARAAKQPVEAIAKSLNSSVPTVRRAITALAFTLELEGLKAGERSALAKALTEAAPKEPKEAKAPAKAAKAEPKAPAKPKAPASGSATAKALAKKAEQAAKAEQAPAKASKSHTN
jgi:hypothetical protein